MTALVCPSPEVLYRETRPIPNPGPNEVLIKIQALGICGSDVHAFHGKQAIFSYPRVMGHEISAEVIKTGSSASQFRAGEQVVVVPYAHCGTCIACHRGKTNCCNSLSVLGVHRDGAMQEYITVAEKYLLKVQDIKPLDAALIEPYAIAAHAVRRSGIQAGDQVLVAGAGAIGLGAADICRALGATVIIAEPNEKRLLSAMDLYKFPYGLNPLKPEFDEQLKSLTKGNGPVIIIDATGNRASMNSHFERLAAGGTIVFVGFHAQDVQFSDLAFHKREASLYGSRGATKEDFKKVIELAAAKKISLGKMRSHVVNFAQLDQQKFAELTLPEVIKSVVVF
jgi:2-desacetyl-2-hydroxyethyl bacteriochlorophyllide A dehydrogenase